MMASPEKSPDFYLQALFRANQLRASQTLFHRVDHAGFGAIASRLMTGLNISLALDANYSFIIDSPYAVESVFDIGVKQPIEVAQNQEIIEWDFMRDTWNASPEIKADHQYPQCPLKEGANLSRHQWCAVLAKAICGTPSKDVKGVIDELKNGIHWNSYDIKIGLHVRRGDKNSECPYVPTECYLTQIKSLIDKNPQKKIIIFVSSDDPGALHDLKSWAPELNFSWDENEARYNNFNAGMVAMNNELAFQESITAAKNILMLGDCDYVVGMCHAQFSWIGGLLSVFNNQFIF